MKNNFVSDKNVCRAKSPFSVESGVPRESGAAEMKEGLDRGYSGYGRTRSVCGCVCVCIFPLCVFSVCACIFCV